MTPPAFQFYAKDFLISTTLFQREEVGDYIRLLSWQWDNGHIPSDPAELEMIARGKVSARVMGKFVFDAEGKGRNQRLEVERQKQAAYREKQSAKGQAGADARWHRHSTGIATANGTGIAKALPEPMAQASSGQWQNDGSSSSSSEKKEEKGAGKPPRKPTERSPANGLEEVKAFFTENGGSEAKAIRFWHHYEANGWVQGRSPLKQWKSAASKWCLDDAGPNMTPSGNLNGRSNGLTPQHRAGMETELREHEQQFHTTDRDSKPKVQARIDELRKALGHLEPQSALL